VVLHHISVKNDECNLYIQFSKTSLTDYYPQRVGGDERDRQKRKKKQKRKTKKSKTSKWSYKKSYNIILIIVTTFFLKT